MSEWISVADCKTCKETHIEYKKEGFNIPLKCSTCFPGVHSYNKATYIVYNGCSDQYIVGNNGIIGLNILAINSILDDHEVINCQDRIEIREEVRYLSNLVNKITRAKAEKK